MKRAKSAIKTSLSTTASASRVSLARRLKNALTIARGLCTSVPGILRVATDVKCGKPVELSLTLFGFFAFAVAVLYVILDCLADAGEML